MKVFAYSYRKFDEAPYFEKYCKELGIELGYTEEDPTLENAHLAAGYPYISILLTRVDAALVEEFARLGVKMISNRLIGVDHVDVKRAKELGIRISNAPYSSNCVADYTLMLMLMSIRRMRQILRRNEMNDFTLPGIQGMEMANLTVGVLGTGKIGRTVIRDLHGFGSRVLAYDLYENDEVKQYATYVDLDTILRQSDMLTLHMPLTDENDAVLHLGEGLAAPSSTPTPCSTRWRAARSAPPAWTWSRTRSASTTTIGRTPSSTTASSPCCAGSTT